MTAGITGTTRFFPIIGAPVAQVFSPPAFNAWFRAQGVDCRMQALEIPPEGLAAFLDLLRHSPSLIGCSVTYPHKQAAFAAVDHMTDRAARLGALNTIRRNADGSLTGDATDGAAMCSAITARNGTISGATARIIGAGGGAGQAIADGLCTAGLCGITLEDHDIARLRQVQGIVGRYWPQVAQLPCGSMADIVINATTLGKSASDPCPFDHAAVAAARIVCDAVTASAPTRLVTAGARQGKITVTGADMGACQLPAQLAFLGLCEGGQGRAH